MTRRLHPLHDISAAEIRRAAEIVTRIHREKHGPSCSIRFKNISLREPPKALLVPYLEAESSGVPAVARPFVPRLVSVIGHPMDNVRDFFEIIVSLDSGTEVDRITPKPGQHASFDW
jgi:primary-amine oxidase